MNRALLTAIVALPALTAVGCGHSEDEWRAQLVRYDQVVGERDAKDKEIFRMEATKIEPGPLPDSLFVPPAGYQKFDIPNMGGMNPLNRGQ